MCLGNWYEQKYSLSKRKIMFDRSYLSILGFKSSWSYYSATKAISFMTLKCLSCVLNLREKFSWDQMAKCLKKATKDTLNLKAVIFPTWQYEKIFNLVFFLSWPLVLNMGVSFIQCLLKENISIYLKSQS